jgi:hypothetical protein
MKRAGYAVVALFLSCGFLAFGLDASLSAHHSFAAHYDMSNAITVQGTIVNVRLTNPHSWFFIDVKEADGKTTHWAFEAGTPSGMIRNGYKASELPKGTMVTISGFRARERSDNTGMLRTLTTADGRTYGMFGPQEGPGAK